MIWIFRLEDTTKSPIATSKLNRGDAPVQECLHSSNTKAEQYSNCAMQTPDARGIGQLVSIAHRDQRHLLSS